MADTVDIRTATKADLGQVKALCDAEGWHHPIEYHEMLYDQSPRGMIVGCDQQGQIVALCGLVSLSPKLSFLANFVVKSEYRGQGLGKKIFQAGLTVSPDSNIALNSVVGKEPIYKHLGIKTIAFTFLSGKIIPDKPNFPPSDVTVREATASDLQHVLDYEATWSPMSRKNILRYYFNSSFYKKVFAFREGTLVGWAMVHPTPNYYRLNPLYAEDNEVASAIWERVVTLTPGGSRIDMQLPSVNERAIQFYESLPGEKAALEPSHSLMFKNQDETLGNKNLYSYLNPDFSYY